MESVHAVADRYRLEERIGSGGNGMVWRAVDEELGRVVAVKRALTGDDQRVALLRREARILARVSHPNVVTVYDLVPDGGAWWLVMEYVPARSLAEHGTLPPGRVAEIGVQLACGLRAVHEAGVLHRDVKPGNVLLSDHGQAKLGDFGISRSPDGEITITDVGTVIGTPAYVAPEVANGADPSPASDVFSLGATPAASRRPGAAARARPEPGSGVRAVGVPLARARGPVLAAGPLRPERATRTQRRAARPARRARRLCLAGRVRRAHLRGQGRAPDAGRRRAAGGRAPAGRRVRLLVAALRPRPRPGAYGCRPAARYSGRKRNVAECRLMETGVTSRLLRRPLPYLSKRTSRETPPPYPRTRTMPPDCLVMEILVMPYLLETRKLAGRVTVISQLPSKQGCALVAACAGAAWRAVVRVRSAMPVLNMIVLSRGVFPRLGLAPGRVPE
ncbi:serine/threonine-protein kinase [Nonomuraea sp. NPDC050536]|uniref:serine/threonine-protein kinase n=1 Tax=Nonomuraea sp. NPDC050536 TaxID=3364366 RepID=UPI0037C6F88C